MAGEMEFIFFIAWMVTTIAAMPFVILFVLYRTMTPANLFLKARFGKRPLLQLHRRDRKIDFQPADSYIEGLAVCKKYNAGYIIDRDAADVEKKSGVTILPCNAEIGIVMSDKVLSIISGLKQAGYNSIEEAFSWNARYGTCTCGYEGFMNVIITKDKESGDESYTLICPHENKEVEHGIDKDTPPQGTQGEGTEREGEPIPDGGDGISQGSQSDPG